MSHAVSNRAIVQTLVSCELLLEFVSDSDEQEASFGAVNCDLADEFVKALLKQAFSYGINAHVLGFSLV